MFKEKGYRTAAFGKGTWAGRCHSGVGRKKKIKKSGVLRLDKAFSGGPIEQGFDRYFGDGTINFPLPLDRERPIRNHPKNQSSNRKHWPEVELGSGPMAES